MYREFRKYFIWLPEHEGKMLFNFKRRAMKRLANMFGDARKTPDVCPKWILPDIWKELLHFWDTNPKFKLRSEIGKKARASEKGGSLHCCGAISQGTVKRRMELELGRPVTQEELFKATRTRKKKNSTDEDQWVEPRAQRTYDQFTQSIVEHRRTLPTESQSAPLSQEEAERLWIESVGGPVRGSVYGLGSKAYHNMQCGLEYVEDGEEVDRTAMVAMEQKIALLTKELAAASERERLRDEQMKEVAERERLRDEQMRVAAEREKERYLGLQAQIDALLASGGIPRCPSDATRHSQPHRRGLQDEDDGLSEEEDDEEEDADIDED